MKKWAIILVTGMVLVIASGCATKTTEKHSTETKQKSSHIEIE